MPARLASSKKGDNGTILVVGGSRFYHGAPLLASMAALRSGADLVYTAVPRSITTAVRAFSPNIIALPLPDDKLTVGSANRLAAMLPKRADCAAIGMGMSIARPEALVALVSKLSEQGTKLLLDASALIPEVLPHIAEKGNIVTPHAGEYKRLFQNEVGSTEKERVENVKLMAKEHSITVLLKGPTDIISDGLRTGVNKTHNCAMTVGGTGDVLSGLTAGLLARIRQPFEAALLGAYINGSAGNLAFKRVGLHMVSTDLIDALPATMKLYDKIRK
jgi:NAD(P)H-hydrate epimerase